MARPLPPLRRELDMMPSPAPDQPGLLIRDPFQYSDAVIIVPPVLVRGLAFFDGRHEDLDLIAYFTQQTGDLRAGDVARHLIETLDQCGFLDSERFFEIREKRQRAFAEAPDKAPAHAGMAYAAEEEALREQLLGWGAARGISADHDRLLAIAAPHVSPEGGYRSYAAAYNRLHSGLAQKTFVILGTSHYGEPEKFGLTRKNYRTPLGTLRTATNLVGELEAKGRGAVVMEDYCHATEHSVEFQCVFLQHALGRPDLRVVPILCGPFVESLVSGKPPDHNENVRRFLDVLGEWADRRRRELVWVLGVDLAHIGRRYGDAFAASSNEGPMTEVRRLDEQRLERIAAGDHEGFYELVRPNADELRWCGYSPLYTFLRAVPAVRGELLRYEQWNIDEQSVVSFTAMAFREAEPPAAEAPGHPSTGEYGYPIVDAV